MADMDTSAPASDRNQLLDLSNKRRISVRKFRGAVIVDIREYFTPKGSKDLKPTKKGISLPLEQWIQLKLYIDRIDEMINKTIPEK
jgi:hypothetical protein